MLCAIKKNLDNQWFVLTLKLLTRIEEYKMQFNQFNWFNLIGLVNG